MVKITFFLIPAFSPFIKLLSALNSSIPLNSFRWTFYYSKHFSFFLVFFLEKMVLPGDYLSAEEEFSPSFNTFERDGSIFSAVAGEPNFDNNEREVSVKAKKSARLISPRSIVFGVISKAADDYALVKMFYAEEFNEERFLPRSHGRLPIANVERAFVKSVKDKFRQGDIIKAKIASIKPWGIDLRTNERELGVIKAFSVESREPLHLIGNQLKCLSTGLSEQRKISSDYLLK